MNVINPTGFVAFFCFSNKAVTYVKLLDLIYHNMVYYRKMGRHTDRL